MKKSLFKKIIACVLSLTLAFSLSGATFGASHAANGANVMPDSLKWQSYSVRDDIHTGKNTDWENALLEAMNDDMAICFGKYYTKLSGKNITYDNIWAARTTALGKVVAAGYDEQSDIYKKYAADSQVILDYQSWTHGVLTGTNKGSQCTLDCTEDVEGSTGGDGDYDDGVLIGDNPNGLYIFVKGIPVEYGRYYTLDFEVANTLVSDKDNQRKDKHALLKAYDYQSPGDPGASFESVKIDGKDAAKDGSIVLKKTPNESTDFVYSHIQATFKIPAAGGQWSSGKDTGAYTHVGIMLTLGAFSFTYPEEDYLKGKIRLRNVKLLAGTQYRVNYYDGSTFKSARYVNKGERAPSVSLKKKNYTLNGFTNKATGATYNFKSLVYSNLNLQAKWIKTPKPKKAAFTLKGKKKKAIVKFKKNKNAKGYQVKYSNSKKFKKKAKYKTKTKTTSKTKTYTIKSLKRNKLLYVKARAYNKDSCGNKKYGKWSKRKVVYIK